MATVRFLVVCAVAFGTVLLLQQTCGGGQSYAQELFAFPADVAVSPSLENARNRTPVYIPGKCSTNEILYPGDHDNDWVCDCRPGYVYSPPQDSCFPLYQQGFCKSGEYVDLARPSMIVQCTRNVCGGKNEVPYKGKCVQLHRNNRMCKIEKRVSWVIGVNITTLELDCIKGTTEMLELTVNNRNMEDEDDQQQQQQSQQPQQHQPMAMKFNPVFFEGVQLCHTGTKAMYNGKCP